MFGDKLVYMLQALGRIPGLSFFDDYAQSILEKQLEMRSHKERALELKERGDDVAEFAKPGQSKGAAGGTSRSKGGCRHPSGPGGRASAGGPGEGATGGGGRLRQGSSPQGEDVWGTENRGLRKGPASNRDRLHDPDDGRSKKSDRLRRKNYDL